MHPVAGCRAQARKRDALGQPQRRRMRHQFGARRPFTPDDEPPRGMALGDPGKGVDQPVEPLLMRQPAHCGDDRRRIGGGRDGRHRGQHGVGNGRRAQSVGRGQRGAARLGLDHDLPRAAIQQRQRDLPRRVHRLQPRIVPFGYDHAQPRAQRGEQRQRIDLGQKGNRHIGGQAVQRGAQLLRAPDHRTQAAARNGEADKLHPRRKGVENRVLRRVESDDADLPAPFHPSGCDQADYAFGAPGAKAGQYESDPHGAKLCTAGCQTSAPCDVILKDSQICQSPR